MNRSVFMVCLALLALPACDSNDEGPQGDPYFLRLDGTAGLQVNCTITVRSRNGTVSVAFPGLLVPDEADLGTILGASAICFKDQEDGLLRLELLLGTLVIDSAESTAPFASVSVSSL